MTIKDLETKYSLSKNDFWELPSKKGTWIISHNACEKIATIEGIVFEMPVIVGYTPTIKKESGIYKTEMKSYNGKSYEKKSPSFDKIEIERGEIIMVVKGFIPNTTGVIEVWATGEANGQNCTAEYYGAMAEKRAKDRVILKLINAYEYGIYSEVEADTFKKQKAQKKAVEEAPKITSIIQLKKKLQDLGAKTGEEALNILNQKTGNGYTSLELDEVTAQVAYADLIRANK